MPIHHSNPQCNVCGGRHAADHVEECRDQLAAILSQVRSILSDSPELNMGNYSKDDAAKLNDGVCEAFCLLEDVPAAQTASPIPKRIGRESQ